MNTALIILGAISAGLVIFISGRLTSPYRADAERRAEEPWNTASEQDRERRANEWANG